MLIPMVVGTFQRDIVSLATNLNTTGSIGVGGEKT